MTTLANKSSQQAIEAVNNSIVQAVEAQAKTARETWTVERLASDSLQVTALNTCIALFKLRVTLYKNKQMKQASNDGFAEYALRQVFNFSGANKTSFSYYRAYKNKIDVINYMFKGNAQAIKDCEPTTEAIEALANSAFKSYTTLNQALNNIKEARKEKKAESDAKKGITKEEKDKQEAYKKMITGISRLAFMNTDLESTPLEVGEAIAVEELKICIANALSAFKDLASYNKAEALNVCSPLVDAILEARTETMDTTEAVANAE